MGCRLSDIAKKSKQIFETESAEFATKQPLTLIFTHEDGGLSPNFGKGYAAHIFKIVLLAGHVSVK